MKNTKNTTNTTNTKKLKKIKKWNAFSKNIEKALINKLSFPKEKINNNRVKIDTGFACNANCYYCYYKDHLNDDFINSAMVYAQIESAKNFGFTEVEFSGGESSTHPDFIKWIQFAKNNDFKCSTLTNALEFQDKEYLKKCYSFGLTEILFSFHGTENTHNKIIGLDSTKINAYRNLLSTIKEFNKLGGVNRVNIIVHKDNITEIPDLVSELLENNIEYNITQFNFLPINGWSDAYKISTKNNKIILDNIEYLIKAIDILEQNGFKDNQINIRYFQYCLLPQKYHKYIKNVYHHFFDKTDWFPLFIDKKEILDTKLPQIDVKDLDSSFFKKHIYNVRTNDNSQYFKDYSNSKVCLDCDKRDICDGFKK